MAHRNRRPQARPQAGSTPGPLQEPDRLGPALRADPDHRGEGQGDQRTGRADDRAGQARRSRLPAAVVAAFPNEPLVVTKLFDEIAPKYADRLGIHPDRPPRPALRRRGKDRPDRARLAEVRKAGPTATTDHSDKATAPKALEGAPVRYRARVEYDGTDFAIPGAAWGTDGPGELEAALATISGGSRVRVVAAGRTDAGVHATGQVIAFTTDGQAGDGSGQGAQRPAAGGRGGPRTAASPGRVHPRYAARYREYRYTV